MRFFRHSASAGARGANRTTSALAIAAFLAGAPFASGPVWAETHEEGRGPGSGGEHDDGGEHDEGGGHDGHDGGEHDEGGGHGGGQGDGEGGSAEPGGQADTGGGRDQQGEGGGPVWSREGIPAVELGRLNVARSPDHVLEAAYAEALAGFTADMAVFYNMTLDEAVTQLSLNWDSLNIIDSPLQNLALLDEALNGTSVLNTLPQVDNSVEVLAAMFLGAASDKTLPITTESVIALATILGHDLNEAQAAALAEDAEAIRIAVLAGHG